MDVNEFLNQLDNIKSFSGKIKYADQNLERIGSGSGRIVYIIDENKVLKLAKNAKGIAQNEVESGIGYNYTTKHIVAEVFDNSDDNSWILVEKAKKVNERRIKELTGIPSLWELKMFLTNHIEQNKGRRHIFGQDQEMVDFFWENEFAFDLVNFVVNYGQSVGDMGRPSTYGEVIKDGQPAIVLTDYGLNDEVFDSHYSRKSQYNLYELHHAGVSYGDHLADIGNVSQEVRHGMWALVPADVGDGDEINEELVNFILNRSVYPKQATNRLPQLADIFHSNLNNLGVIIKSVEDPTLFVKNLIALQNYLISHNYYNRQPISINDKPELTKEILDELDEGVKREVADVIANKIAQKRNYNQLDYIGSGTFGSAYDIGDGKVLKITSDHTEANENMYLKGKSLKYIAHPYEVSKINLSDGKEIFLIVLEKLKTDLNTFKKHIDLLDEFFEENIGRGYADIIGDYMHYGWDDSIETVDFRRFMKNNPETANFFHSVLAIADELKKYGVGSMDFVSPVNLGYKNDGTLAFFDVGFGNYFQPASQDIQSVEVDEGFAAGGGTKFTTDNNVSSDGFPTYNNIDTSPSIHNDLGANSAMYNEDLEYNHVDDATKDQYIMTEMDSGVLEFIGYDGDGKAYMMSVLDDEFVCFTTKDVAEKIASERKLRRTKMTSIYAVSLTYGIYSPDTQDYFGGMKPKPVLSDRVAIFFKTNSPPHVGFASETMWRRDVNLTSFSVRPYLDGVVAIEKSKYNINPDDDFVYYEESLDLPQNEYLGNETKGEYIEKRITKAQNEGVGDKYLERKYLNQFKDDFEKKYLKYTVKDVTLTPLPKPALAFRDGASQQYQIYENPSTLRKFEENVRGLVIENGDYYVCSRQAVLHQEIAIGLRKNGKLTFQTPQELYNIPDKIIPVIRRGLSDTLEIAASYQGTDMELVNNIFNNAASKSGGGVKFRAVINKKDRGGGQKLIPEEVSVDLPSKLGSFDTYEIKDKNTVIGEISIADRGVHGDNHYITIDKIFINEEFRGKGYATSIMGDVLAYADENDMIITLTPDNMWSASKTKLINWYKSLGFIMNMGRKKDFYTIQLMYRLPKNLNEKYLVGNKNNSTFTKINENISTLQQLEFIPEIESLGGKIYLVGGAVRDEFLGKESKDLDLIITGVPLEELSQILPKYGKTDFVGESYGVYKFIPKGSTEVIDITIPRTETPTGGGGHKDFDVKSDHKLPIEKDLYRRDFTINAMAKDMKGNIVDPYGGQEDLQNKTIKAVNPDAFSDDPLRMLRAVQFASRFGFTIEPHTFEMIQKSLDGVGNIAMDRRYAELDKIREKGDMRYGAQLLKDTGLFKRLFGYELNQSTIDNAPFDSVNTTAEFIFLILQESQNPEELFKTRIHNLTDDYKMIKALKLCFSRHSNNPVHSRMVAHDMHLISPNSLKSQILPNQVLIAANELLSGKYPKTVNELAIDGYDLMALNLYGEEIKKMKNLLLKNTYSDKVVNNKERLLDMANNQINSIKEELSSETLEKAKKNIPIKYTGIIIDRLKADRLLKMFSQYIPDDWKIEEKPHVTIKLGGLKDYDPMKRHVGWPIHVMATHIGMSNLAIALRVELPNEIITKNEIPHITLASNKNAGGKPMHSNDITEWQQLKRPIRIRGMIEEVPEKFNVL